MLKTITINVSLFLLLRISFGTDTPGRNTWVTYRDIDLSTLSNPLNITVQPVNQADCKGNKITFSVTAEGGAGAIHYQWKRKRPSDASFALFGAKDSTKLPVYNIGTGSEAPNGTLYQVTVTDQDTVVNSSIASLTVNEITGIAPVGVATYTVNQGENLWFKVLTSGNIPNAYQWIKKYGTNDWRNLTDNSTLSGSQREQLDFTKISLADSGIYKLRVTFPTINGNQCIETSTITRRVFVNPVVDNEPPIFLNMNNEYKTLCPEDLIQADWSESMDDILPVRIRYYHFRKYSTLFDLPTIQFSDNVTPSAALILHWGIFSVTSPFNSIRDEAGTLLDDKIGQISLHPENIDFENQISGDQTYQIVFWLEDGAGNLTPVANRHKIEVTVPLRPEIISDF